jgi:hypothetical protein
MGGRPEAAKARIEQSLREREREREREDESGEFENVDTRVGGWRVAGWLWVDGQGGGGGGGGGGGDAGSEIRMIKKLCGEAQSSRPRENCLADERFYRMCSERRPVPVFFYFPATRRARFTPQFLFIYLIRIVKALSSRLRGSVRAPLALPPKLIS